MELIISIMSLVVSALGSILTGIVTYKVSKMNNLEAVHKYNKPITKFELSFKDEAWLVGIMQSGEFSRYDEESKKLIHQWWLEYKAEHEPKQAKSTLPKSKKFSGARYKLARPTTIKQRPNTRRPGGLL